MRGLITISTSLLIATFGLAAPAHAQSQPDWKACRSGEVEARIAGCTRLLDRGRLTARDRASAYTNRAYCYNEKSQFDLAIRDLDAAVRLDPSNASAFNNRGFALNAKGEWDRAIRDYDEAIRLKPDLAAAVGNRGRSYQNKGDYDGALRDFDELVRRDPKSPGNHNLRGNAYFAKSDYDRAILNYGEAIRLDPKNHVYYNNRGNAYRHKRDYDRALTDLDQSLRLNSSYVTGLQNRGHVYYAKADYDRAIRDYDEAIRHEPRSAANFTFRGNAYRNKGDEERALADYDQAVKLDPRDATTLRNRAQAYLNKGDSARALHDVDEAIRLDPKSAGNYNLRGLAHKERRDFDRAIHDFDEAIRLSPRLAVAYSNRGDAYRLKNDVDRAIGDLGEALRLDSKMAAALTSRGLAFEVKGDRERARSDFKAALALPATRGVAETWAVETARAHLAMVEAGAPSLAPAPAAAQPVVSALAPPVASPEQAGAPGRRVALVIGNGAYQHATPLANPTNDAADLSATLRKLGFDVVEGRDLDKHGMEGKIREFGRRLERADLAMFFYAGHGLQVADKNYLVPIDAKLERPGDLTLDTVTVDDVLVQMESEPRVNLVMLDACRDNPLARSLARSLGARSGAVGQGLAPIQSAVGTMIIYATQPKNVALDGEGRNSPFTTALLKHIATPGLEIGAVMKRVRADVYRATREKQLPWDHSSLIGDVVLAR